MTLQQVIEELKNIREQATNHDEISKGSVIEAITDLIHDAGGDGFDLELEDDYYESFEEPDFTKLEIM